MFQLNSFSNIHYKGEVNSSVLVLYEYVWSLSSADQEVLYLCVLRKKLANY